MAETQYGYIYALISPAMVGLIKIGVTSKHPLERTKELSAATGIPVPFVLAHYRFVRDPFGCETAIYRQLDAVRTNDSREFFRIEVVDAIEMINQFKEVAPWELQQIDTPFAELFATFPDDGEGRELDWKERMAVKELRARLYG